MERAFESNGIKEIEHGKRECLDEKHIGYNIEMKIRVLKM